MTTTTLHPTVQPTNRVSRAILFRIVAAAVAAIYIVLFGAWQSILAPWLVLPDGADHGWTRTNELHVLADAASGLLMFAVGVAAVLLAIRPLRRSGVVVWVVGTLTLISIGSAVSTMLQGHDGWIGAALTGVLTLFLFAVPLVLLHPERRQIIVGGAPDAAGGPTRSLTAVFAVVGAIGLAVAVGVIGWRLTGGLFENPAEDDVVALALLCLSIAVGSALCALAREGWRLLAGILGAMVLYAVVAGLMIAFL